MRLLLTTALVTSLIAPAYAGSGKNALEERVFLDDLRPIEDTASTTSTISNSSAVASPTIIESASQAIYTPPPVITPAEQTSPPKTYNRLKPRVEGNWRYSNDRSILMSEFWVPLAQNEADGSVLFGDVRVMGDNGRNREFNIGAGYREIVNSKLLGDGIAGGMVWYDRRFTKRGSKFNQVTAGLEWLGEQYDVRLCRTSGLMAQK